MRRLAPALVVFFVWAAPAHAKPIVNVQASSTLGAAPLMVTLTASGGAVSYHWDFGDRAVADGPFAGGVRGFVHQLVSDDHRGRAAAVEVDRLHGPELD